MDQMIDSLMQEIKQRKDFLQNKSLDSIYLGGGTPSLISSYQLDQLFSTINQYFSIKENAEITLEANPDDITPAYAKELQEIGINRLSMGIQSFNDNDLNYLGRIHNAQEAHDSIKQSQDAGITNITIDLMYGIPTTSSVEWRKNLDQLLIHNIPHFSAYALTIEPKTFLEHQIRKEKVTAPPEDKYINDFKVLKAFVNEEGFDHYEISNFSKPGFHALHNSNYWKGAPYLGIGPGAHSFDGEIRQWNIANNARYIKSAKNGEPLHESEKLTLNEKLNETIMTGLRTKWGINLKEIRSNFGGVYFRHLNNKKSKLLEKGYILEQNEKLYLAPGQTLMADSIISDLFFVE